jgi:integrase/recombinase XerD
MTDKAISPLRQRMIEDMTIRKSAPKTPHDYVQRVKSRFSSNQNRSSYKRHLQTPPRVALAPSSVRAKAPEATTTRSAPRLCLRRSA